MIDKLVCLNCKIELKKVNNSLSCTSCKRTFEIKNKIFISNSQAVPEYFDTTHDFMTSGNELPEIQQLCYMRQRQEAQSYFNAGDVILDVGCGPTICYQKLEDNFLIGVEPSYPSIKLNNDLDLGICGSASSLPLPNNSVDCILMFYSIHHMTSNSRYENTKILTDVLTECNRVIKKNGKIIIFDMDPWIPFWFFQNFVWNFSKKKLKNKLDMYFWKEKQLKEISFAVFGDKKYTKKIFKSPLLMKFSPVFSLPNFKIPRILYPFQVKMYKWDF